jgi:hypothetical protein
MEIEWKKCARCKEKKDKTCFYKDKSKKDGLCSLCKICDCKKGSIYRKEHPNEVRDWQQRYRENNPILHRHKHDKRTLKLNANESDIANDYRINGKCFYCHRSAKECGRKIYGGKLRLCVDHDHVTGVIRGILCHDCNAFEGQLKIQAAIGILKVPIFWKNWWKNPPGIPGIHTNPRI